MGYSAVWKSHHGSQVVQRALEQPRPQLLRLNHYSVMSMERFARHHGGAFGSVSGNTPPNAQHKDVRYFIKLEAEATSADRLLADKRAADRGESAALPKAASRSSVRGEKNRQRVMELLRREGAVVGAGGIILNKQGRVAMLDERTKKPVAATEEDLQSLRIGRRAENEREVDSIDIRP